MKRCLCLILALLMMSSALPALAEEPWKPGNNTPRELLSDGERFYLFTEGVLYVCEKDGTPEPFITNLPYDTSKAYNHPEFADSLMLDGDTLYGLNRQSGTVYAFALKKGDAELLNTYQLDFSAITVEANGYSYVQYVDSTVIANGKMWGTIHDYNDTRMLSFDLATGACNKYKTGNIKKLTPYKDGTFLCFVYDEENAYNSETREYSLAPIGIFDPAADSFTQLREYPMRYYDLQEIAYDLTSDTLYCYAGNRIYRMVNLGDPELCAYSPFAWLSSGGLALAGNVMGLIGQTGFITRTLDPAMLPDQELIIYGNMNTAAHTRAVSAMGNIPVLESTQSIEYAELSQAIITGTIEADILCLPVDYVDIPRIMQKGYCAPLTESKIITDYVDTLYPFFKDAMMEGGTVYGIPAEMWAYGPAVGTRGAFEKVNLSVPESMGDVLEIVRAWGEEELYDKYPDYSPFSWFNSYRANLIEMVLSMWGDYLTAENIPWTLKDPRLEKLLKEVEALDTSDWEVVIDWDSPDAELLEEELINRNALLEQYMDYSIEDVTTLGATPLALTPDMDAYVGVDMYIFLINARSPHKEAAIQYLEAYIQSMEDSDLAMFQADWNEPILNPRQAEYIADAEEEIALLEKALEGADAIDVPDLEEQIRNMKEILEHLKSRPYLVSAEDIAVWKGMMAHGFVKRPSMFYSTNPNNTLRQLLAQYSDGQISLEQFLNEGENRIRIMLLEDN